MVTRVALVTGASRGIGRAIALRLARNGATVAVNYREHGDQAASVVEEITRSGGRAIAIAADLGEAADCARLVEQARRDLGPIDILVNNAGVLRKGDLADFDFAQMDEMRRINVDGLAHVTRAVVGDMTTRGWGLSSTSPRLPASARLPAAPRFTPRPRPPSFRSRAALRWISARMASPSMPSRPASSRPKWLRRAARLRGDGRQSHGAPSRRGG